METVKMTHPDLEGQVAEVPTSAVSQHKLSGWQLADDDMTAEDVDAELEQLAERQKALLERKAADEAAEQAESTDGGDEGGEPPKPAKKSTKKSSN